MGCKLEHARQWKVRLVHESKLYLANSFITLTYDEQHVPQNFGLDLRHWQLFNKKLRKSLDHKIRFYACGEYGDENGRPHYHAILFNHDFSDKKRTGYNDRGDPIFESDTLTALWGKGRATTQDVTPASCGYVARYCTKKLKTSDDFGQDRYYRLSPVDGCMHKVKPEFAVMSRRPGIGLHFFLKHRSDFFPSGTCVVDGVEQALPLYYKQQLTEAERHTLQLKALNHVKPRQERSVQRRRDRAEIRDARIRNLKRKL
jgi:hypothetical protein